MEGVQNLQLWSSPWGLCDTELAGAMQIFVHVNSEYIAVIRINRN